MTNEENNRKFDEWFAIPENAKRFKERNEETIKRNKKYDEEIARRANEPKVEPEKPLKYYEDPDFHDYESDEQRDYWRKYGKVMNVIWWIGFTIINVYWVIFTSGNPEAIIEFSIGAFFAIYAFYIIWSLFIWIPYAFDYYPEGWSNHKFIHIIGILMMIIYWTFRIITIIGNAIGIKPV